jgi:hypothetical protein
MHKFTAMERETTVPRKDEPADRIIQRAMWLFALRNPRVAVAVLYTGAFGLIPDTIQAKLEQGLTHRERLEVKKREMPEIYTHVRALTYFFELANYSGRRIQDEHVHAAIAEFTAINELLGRADKVSRNASN